MKKYLGLSIVIFSFLLSGCGSRGLSAEEAGELFVDRLVYQKDESKFAANFRDGKKLGQELDENSASFEENFVEGLASSGVEVPEDEANQLTKDLLQQVKQKTSYKIVKIDETKKGATISYYVVGLDIVSAMQEMTRELIKKTINDPEIAKDDQKAVAATFSILDERVKAIKIKSDPVKLSVRLEKEKGKWFVPKDQEEAVSNLFMAFISGSKDAETMEKELEEALAIVANEVVDSLNTPTLTTETQSSD